MDLLQRGEAVRMVRNNEEIEWPVEFRFEAGRGGDLFAPRETDGLFWPKAHAKGKGIRGIGRMEVGITPQNLLRIVGEGNIRI